jgi:hypothetical protein
MKKHNRIFQTASENRSQQIKVYHRMCELVRNGRIGELKSIRVELPAGHWVKPASQEWSRRPRISITTSGSARRLRPLLRGALPLELPMD